RHHCLLHRVQQLGLEADRCLGAVAFRYVRHCADHADGRAGAVSSDVAAVRDVRVTTIPATVAILITPARRTALYRGFHAGDHALTIFGMEVVAPPLNLGIDLVLLVPEYALDGIVPDERVGRHVPIPDYVVCGSGDELEPLVGAPYGALGLSLIGDVDDDGDGGGDIAIGVA